MVGTTLFPSMVHHSQNVKHVGAPSIVHVLLLVSKTRMQDISGTLLEK